MKLSKKVLFSFVPFLILICSCKSRKTAIELNNKKYTEALNYENKYIDTEGAYVSIDTLISLDEDFKDEITTELMKFNKNSTVQFSIKHNNYKHDIEISNENLTDWLSKYASSYYYTKRESELIIECYEEGPNPRIPWYIPAGPPNGPLHFKRIYKVKGDTLISGKKRFILNRDLTNNHKKIRSNFINLKKTNH